MEANKGGQTRGLVRQALQILGAETSDLDGGDGVLSMTHFSHIQPVPIYRQWEAPVFTDRELGHISRNLWRAPFQPAQDQPADESVQPFLSMLERAYGHEPEAVEFFLDTLAFQLKEHALLGRSWWWCSTV